MYDWYYNKLQKKYGKNCTLLYTNTDSLLVDIKTEDVYKDMSETKDEYDFSDYPTDHPLYDERSKKVIGKPKDECAGAPTAEYISLRPKLYSVFCERMDNSSKKQKEQKYVIKHRSILKTIKMHCLTNKHTHLK